MRRIVAVISSAVLTVSGSALLLTGVASAAKPTTTGGGSSGYVCQPSAGKNAWVITQNNGNGGKGTFAYAGPVDSKGHPVKGDDVQWCEDHQPGDMCANMTGKQATVPAGLVVDANGNCVTPAAGGKGGDSASSTKSQVTTTPTGGVNAGGAGSVVAPLAALVASVGSLGYGVLRLRKFNA
jgi:hypothetical protein